MIPFDDAVVSAARQSAGGSQRSARPSAGCLCMDHAALKSIMQRRKIQAAERARRDSFRDARVSKEIEVHGSRVCPGAVTLVCQHSINSGRRWTRTKALFLPQPAKSVPSIELLSATPAPCTLPPTDIRHVVHNGSSCEKVTSRAAHGSDEHAEEVCSSAEPHCFCSRFLDRACVKASCGSQDGLPSSTAAGADHFVARSGTLSVVQSGVDHVSPRSDSTSGAS